jgi:hypothetical protein
MVGFITIFGYTCRRVLFVIAIRLESLGVVPIEDVSGKWEGGE